MNRSSLYPSNPQSGNIIWIILLSVFLLGALTAMISRSGTSTNQKGDIEKQSIKIAEVLRYASDVERAVAQLQSSGCSENELSFESAQNTGYQNTVAPSDNTCHLYHHRGAGLKWKTGDLNADWAVTRFLNISGVGEDYPELTLILPGIDEQVCRAINNRLYGWTDIPDLTNGTGLIMKEADGTFPGGDALTVILPDNPGPAWKEDLRTACFNNTNASEYVFFHVILSR